MHKFFIKHLSILLPIALPASLFALEFEPGQRYCLGSGGYGCESVWEVKETASEGTTLEERWRVYSPTNMSRKSERRARKSKFQVRLTSRYEFEGSFLCEKVILAAEFQYEIEPKNVYFGGKLVRVSKDVPSEVQESFLDEIRELRRCFQFSESCVDKAFDHVSTLRKGYYFGNRGAGSSPLSGNKKHKGLEDLRREGDRQVRLMDETEVEAEVIRHAIRFLPWKPHGKRMDNTISRLSYNFCAE